MNTWQSVIEVNIYLRDKSTQSSFAKQNKKTKRKSQWGTLQSMRAKGYSPSSASLTRPALSLKHLAQCRSSSPSRRASFLNGRISHTTCPRFSAGVLFSFSPACTAGADRLAVRINTGTHTISGAPSESPLEGRSPWDFASITPGSSRSSHIFFLALTLLLLVQQTNDVTHAFFICSRMHPLSAHDACAELRLFDKIAPQICLHH